MLKTDCNEQRLTTIIKRQDGELSCIDGNHMENIKTPKF